MNTETVQSSSVHIDERVQHVEDVEKAIREYQQSRAFAEDLLDAFAEASEQARQENERLGLSVQPQPNSREAA